MGLARPSQPLVLISGPTAVGKSALAMALAPRFRAEIVSADSRQVYRGMDIGTAKPTHADRARVPHHCLDLVAPDEPYSAARYREDGEAALGAIWGRGRVAFVVGGTLHYIQALVDRLPLPAVPPDAELRRELEAVAAQEGPRALHARLAALDPAAAAEIDARNVRRVVRALEVCLRSGGRFSELGRRPGEARPALRLALGMERRELYRRIDARIRQMLADGWLEEVRRLLACGYRRDLPSMSASGYRELAAHLAGELTLEQAVQRTAYSTHAYARRQLVWLRGDPRWDWIATGEGLVERAAARIAAYLERNGGG